MIIDPVYRVVFNGSLLGLLIVFVNCGTPESVAEHELCRIAVSISEGEKFPIVQGVFTCREQRSVGNR